MNQTARRFLVASGAALALTLAACDAPVGGIHAVERDGPMDGPTVVFFHGAAFTSDVWVETGILDAVSGAGFRAIAVDLPGAGRSPGTTDPAPVWFQGLLEERSIDCPILVAPSASGRVLEEVLSVPNPVDRFGLCGVVVVAPVTRELPGVGVPALVVWGSDDRVVPMSNATPLAESLQTDDLVVIQGGGHAVYQTDTDAFISVLLEWLADLSVAA